MAASSVWTRLALVAVVTGPWMLALSPALLGVPSSSLVVLAVPLGGFVGSSVRDRAFLRLPAASRRSVIAVPRSGRWTGDPALDGIALERVQRAARTAGLDRFLLPVVLALYLAVPVVAAVRDGAWWLACLLPSVLFAAAVPATWPDTRVQLARLVQ